MTKERDSAILWARRIIEQEFVVLDTETTGLDSDDVAVQIGIVNQAGVILLDSYVRPHKPIPIRATQLHGITDAMVQNAPTFREILPILDRAVTDKIVLIYNKEYDQRILLQSADANSFGIEAWWLAPRIWKPERPTDHHPNQTRWQCVMEQFAQFYGDWNDYRGNYRWQKLTVAVSYFGISTEGAHGAVADALTTLWVVEGMAKARLSGEAK